MVPDSITTPEADKVLAAQYVQHSFHMERGEGMRWLTEQLCDAARA